MTNSERMMEAARLRLRLQMNARLRLEVLAALSRVFREYRDPVGDELLAAIVLAVPEELMGEADIEQTTSQAQTPRNPIAPHMVPHVPVRTPHWPLDRPPDKPPIPPTPVPHILPPSASTQPAVRARHSKKTRATRLS